MFIPGEIVQIEDHADPLQSDITLLVAALTALGIAAAAPFHCTYELVRGEFQFRSVWTLKSQDKSGRFETVKMQAAWTDGDWLLKNPKHPLAILRDGLTYARTFSYTPRFTLAELASIEKPETWLEAAMRNLIFLLREIPRSVPEGIVRFGPRWAAMVPKNLNEAQKSRFLNYVEHPTKRHQLSVA